MAIQIHFSLALVIIAFIGLLGWIFYLEYKNKDRDEKKKPRDPFFVSVFVGIFVIFVVLVMEAFGVLRQGFAKSNWWLFIIIMVTTFVWAYRNAQKLKPLKESKLEDIAWEHIWRRIKARPHRGDGYGSPLPFNNITPTREGGAFGKSVNYIARTNFNGGTFVLVSLDMTNGYLLRFIEDPDTLFVKRLFGKEITQQYDLERSYLNKEVLPDETTYEGEKNQIPANQTPV
ncbi:DUF3784 domain-containing protein [Thermodesulfobacteriota bacterium]